MCVDVGLRVAKAISLKDLEPSCLPSSVVADKAAQLLAKVKKETHVEKPFPYMELHLFMPTWVAEVHPSLSHSPWCVA